MNALNTLERDILLAVSEGLACPALDQVAEALAWAGDDGRLFIVLSVALLLPKRTRTLGLAVSAALILELVAVNGILKPLIARIRPYDFDTGLSIAVPRPGGLSFPSGHTAAAFAAAVPFRALGRPALAAGLAAAALMGLSRCYLRVHYPSDVLAGALAGTLCGLAGTAIAKRLARRGIPS